MDLIRKIDGKHWKCSRATWDRILALAAKGGYVPFGTTQHDFDTGEPDDSWDNEDYTSQAGQLVIQEDAQYLAESLERSTTHDAVTEKEIVLEFVQWLKISNEANGEDYYPGFEIW